VDKGNNTFKLFGTLVIFIISIYYFLIKIFAENSIEINISFSVIILIISIFSLIKNFKRLNTPKIAFLIFSLIVSIVILAYFFFKY
jgi:hypothetical protein